MSQYGKYPESNVYNVLTGKFLHNKILVIRNLITIEGEIHMPKVLEKKSEKKQLSLELIDFGNKLQQALATKVQIKGSERKGKIMIEYYSKEDLNRIYNLFN